MYAAGAGKGRSSGGTPWARSRRSDGLGRSQDVPGSGALRQLSLRGRAARSFHQCRTPADRRFRTADRRHAVHARCPWHPADRRRRAGRLRGRADGSRLIRTGARRPIGDRRAGRRNPDRRARGSGNVLAGPAPGRIPAGVSEYPGRHELHHPRRRSVAAGGRHCHPSGATGGARDRTNSGSAGCI